MEVNVTQRETITQGGRGRRRRRRKEEKEKEERECKRTRYDINA